MATFSEIGIKFLEPLDVNTVTNALVISYFDSNTQASGTITQRIVTTRSQTGEFSYNVDPILQASLYKDALDLDIVPSLLWETELLNELVTIKSTVEGVQFTDIFMGAPNEDAFSHLITNYENTIDRTLGVLAARSNHYVTSDIDNAAITQQTIKLWFLSSEFVTDLPTETDYQATILRPSVNWADFDFSISAYARDFLKPTPPDFGVGVEPSAEGSVITASVSVQNNLEILANPKINQVVTTLGYSTYQQGAGFLYNQDILLSSTRHQVKAGSDLTVPVYTLGGITEVVMKDADGNVLVTEIITPTNFIADAISYVTFSTDGLTTEYVTINDIYRFELINECKYETKVVRFLNRYGVFESLTFFKAEKNSLNIERNGAFKNNFVLGGSYSNSRHLYRTTGTTGRESMVFNTGYIHESQNAAIEDLLLSDYVYLSTGEPINVDTNNVEKKTRLVDKLISYEIGFKFSSDLVQTV